MTAVGGTIHVPETAVDFSGGGFSNLVCRTNISPLVLTDVFLQFPRPAFQNQAVPQFLKTLAPGTFKGLFNP